MNRNEFVRGTGKRIRLETLIVAYADTDTAQGISAWKNVHGSLNTGAQMLLRGRE